MKQTLILISSLVVITGCGFKSDLYLPERQPANLPDAQSDLPELPPLPPAGELEAPGVAVDITPLEEQQTNDKKKK